MPEYLLEDIYGTSLARTRIRFWSIGAKFDIYDANDNVLGLVEEELFRFFPTFKIWSSRSKTLAQAKLNFWGTIYNITDPYDGHTIATLSRPFFYLKTTWTLTIDDPSAFSDNKIHPHMFLVIATFQTDSEYWQAQRKNSEIFGQQQKYLDNYYCSSTNAPIKFNTKYCNYISENYNNSCYKNEFLDELDKKKYLLSEIEPDEEDFYFIENLKDIDEINFTSDTQRFYHLAKNYIKLLDSNDLTLKQKKALYIMLHKRLKNLELAYEKDL